MPLTNLALSQRVLKFVSFSKKKKKKFSAPRRHGTGYGLLWCWINSRHSGSPLNLKFYNVNKVEVGGLSPFVSYGSDFHSDESKQ